MLTSKGMFLDTNRLMEVSIHCLTHDLFRIFSHASCCSTMDWCVYRAGMVASSRLRRLESRGLPNLLPTVFACFLSPQSSFFFFFLSSRLLIYYFIHGLEKISPCQGNPWPLGDDYRRAIWRPRSLYNMLARHFARGRRSDEIGHHPSHSTSIRLLSSRPWNTSWEPSGVPENIERNHRPSPRRASLFASIGGSRFLNLYYFLAQTTLCFGSMITTVYR